jgi:hypothetical protein
MAGRKGATMRLRVSKKIAVGLGWPLNKVRLDGDRAVRDAHQLADEIVRFRQRRWPEDYWSCAARPFLALGILCALRFAGEQQRVPSLSDLEVMLAGRPTEVRERLTELTRESRLTHTVAELFEDRSAIVPGILATPIEAVNMYRQAVERGEIPESERTQRRKRKPTNWGDGQLR